MSAVAILASLALMLLCSGLQRRLVICNGPHCDGKVQWSHASGDCCRTTHAPTSRGCAHDHAHAQCHHAGTERGECAAASHGCSDSPLVVEEGPAPERFAFTPDLCAAPAPAAWSPPALTGARVLRELPPTTGPPRPDRQVELLATTVLLL